MISSKARSAPSMRVVLVSVVLWLQLGLVGSKSAFAWGSGDTFSGGYGEEPRCSAHYFITIKALVYLEQKGLLRGWPLWHCLTRMNYGNWYADYNCAQCEWDYGFGSEIHTCDTIHHYASRDGIFLPEVNNAHVAEPGDFAAPEYAQALYDLAIKSWPGGAPVPDLHDLTYKEDAGYITTVFDGDLLGPMVLGGLPFASLIRSIDAGLYPDYVKTDWAYEWPPWTDGTESIDTALTYLGWAMHLVEDLAQECHARNETGRIHATDEELADTWIRTDQMSHLPVSPGNTYKYGYHPGKFYATSPDFFHDDWSIQKFAEESARLAEESTHHPDLGPDDLYYANAQCEYMLDVSIKMVAGVIHKFFRSLPLLESVYVDASAKGDGDGTPERPLTIISLGLSTVRVGGDVIIRRGSYPEQLAIDKAVRLRADPGSGAVLVGDELHMAPSASLKVHNTGSFRMY